MVEPVENGGAEPDLIDRIAGALPEEIRAEYYRELLHCRSLPENDEMLRLLRAMQFLVLLIEQAPSRIAEERERLDKLLATAIGNITKINAASETYHTALQRKITRLPADIANSISPEAIAAKINENLKQEFIRSTIPKTAEALAVISDQMKTVCTEFSTTSDTLGNVYRGAAEDARKAIASLEAGNVSGNGHRRAFHTRAYREVFEGLPFVAGHARGRSSHHRTGDRDDVRALLILPTRSSSRSFNSRSFKRWFSPHRSPRHRQFRNPRRRPNLAAGNRDRATRAAIVLGPLTFASLMCNISLAGGM